MDESKSVKITIELPPELQLSREELAKLLNQFPVCVIDAKEEGQDIQARDKVIRARVGDKTWSAIVVGSK